MSIHLCLTGRHVRGGVAVADAFALPYRAGSCDGVLCIAVLHHIASAARRRRLLQRLCHILRPGTTILLWTCSARCFSVGSFAGLHGRCMPALDHAGGRALVTVWAYEQEEQKLLSKWQRIPQPAGAPAAGVTISGGHGSNGASTKVAGGQPKAGAPGGPAHRRCSTSDHDDSCSGGSADDSLDYMVPWHLPFHRLEASAVAARTVAATGSQTDSARNPDSAAPHAAECAACNNAAGNGVVSTAPSGLDSCTGHCVSRPAVSSVSSADAAGKPFARIDAVKKTIVFERYYHLFRQGELEGLAAEVPGASVVDAFYDKSNWCIVLQRDAAGCAGASTDIAAPPPSIQ